MAEYNSSYFNEGIFATDYEYLAKAIVQAYQPAEAVEFGCGTGSLSRALADLNIKVEAIDGYSEPDFAGVNNVSFTRVDLNNEQQIIKYLNGRRFDIAICTEVAEHLETASSEGLIKQLTNCADVVIFSAAVPYQGGHGHINCQPREFWHRLFTKANFQLKDSLRGKLRENPNLAPWFVLNVLDYVNKDNHNVDLDLVIENLLTSESYSSSIFYKTSTTNAKNEAYLNKPLIRHYLQLRSFLKKVAKRN